METSYLLNDYPRCADPVEDSRRRQRQFLRLAAAAALETHADYSPSEAWAIAGQLPDAVREWLRDAADNSLSAQARAGVGEIIDKCIRRRRGEQPHSYPLFAEPGGFTPAEKLD